MKRLIQRLHSQKACQMLEYIRAALFGLAGLCGVAAVLEVSALGETKLWSAAVVLVVLAVIVSELRLKAGKCPHCGTIQDFDMVLKDKEEKLICRSCGKNIWVNRPGVFDKDD